MGKAKVEMATDDVIVNASSYVQLYSDGNERPSREWQIECKDAAMTFADAYDRPWKFKASSYKFQDRDGLNEIDLRVKVDAGDVARAANAAAAAAASAAASSADVRALAAEAVIAQDLLSEIARAGIAEAAAEASVVAEAALRADADSALDVAYKAADTTLTAAVAAEEVRARAAEVSNQNAIANILGASPLILDSLTELVTQYSGMDAA